MMRQAIRKRTFVGRVLSAPRAVAGRRTWRKARTMGLIPNQSFGISSAGYIADVYDDLKAV